MQLVDTRRETANHSGLPQSKQESLKEIFFSKKNLISLTLICIKIVVGLVKKSKADN